RYGCRRALKFAHQSFGRGPLMRKTLLSFVVAAALGSLVNEAVAQTSRELTRKDPFATYTILKESMAKSNRGSTRPTEMTFQGCVRDYGTFSGKSASDLVDDLVSIATDVIALEKGFTFFPEGLWKQELLAYERQEVADTQNKKTVK